MMTSKIQSRDEGSRKWGVCTMENSFLFTSEYQDLVCMSDYKINLTVKVNIYFIYEEKAKYKQSYGKQNKETNQIPSRDTE